VLTFGLGALTVWSGSLFARLYAAVPGSGGWVCFLRIVLAWLGLGAVLLLAWVPLGVALLWTWAHVID